MLKFFKSSKVEYWYTGASIIIWRDSFVKIGKWPTQYFMYSEDMDFFYLCYRNNYVIQELSNPIMHIGGGCSKNTWSTIEREIIVQRSFKLFFKKYNKEYEKLSTILNSKEFLTKAPKDLVKRHTARLEEIKTIIESLHINLNNY